MPGRSIFASRPSRAIGLCWLLSTAAIAGPEPSTVGAVLPESLRQQLVDGGYELPGPHLEGRLVPVAGVSPSVDASESPLGDAGRHYTELAPGSLVAVLELSRPGVDARGQRLSAGVYTLRYVVQPWTKDHLGRTPYRDFLLVLPASWDSGEELAVGEAVERSRRATETGHPAVLTLAPPPGSETPVGEGVVVIRVGDVEMVVDTRPVDDLARAP